MVCGLLRHPSQRAAPAQTTALFLDSFLGVVLSLHSWEVQNPFVAQLQTSHLKFPGL